MNLRGLDPGHPPLDPADVLARFVRALGAEAPPLPADPDELAGMYHSQLSGQRVLVVRYYIQQSLAIARHASEIRTEGMSLTWLGAVHERLGSFETAISTREQGVAALKQARDK